VLIVHHPKTETEHFVREITFRDAEEAFGFVVPTPSQPTVSKVEVSPFEALARRFSPEPVLPPRDGLRGPSGGSGGGRGAGLGAGPSVTVLSQERVGSFTAFVLAANDAGALDKWLRDNQLTTTPKSKAWLDHYVKQKFFFAALRYEPDAAKKTGTGTRSETMKLTFQTPLPYYPYKEPEHEGSPAAKDRVLAVWLMSPTRSVPVARQQMASSSRLTRPWQEWNRFVAQDASALTRLSPALRDLFASDHETFEVQTFQDQKTSRAGFGDVVLVPEKPSDKKISDEALAKFTAILEASK
jgi:hypothetical protein